MLKLVASKLYGSGDEWPGFWDEGERREGREGEDWSWGWKETFGECTEEEKVGWEVKVNTTVLFANTCQWLFYLPRSEESSLKHSPNSLLSWSISHWLSRACKLYLGIGSLILYRYIMYVHKVITALQMVKELVTTKPSKSKLLVYI